jgi:hypothetical protein
MKKNNANKTVELKLNLKTLMEQHPNGTLAKLADAVDAPVAAVRAKAKQPVQGVAYDASSINYEAIEAYLLKRKPELQLEELDWNKLNEKTERATKVLKDTNIDFSVGKKYYLRYFKSVWQIVYATETHVCIVTEGNTQPKVMAKTTFVNCGVKPEDFKPEATEK